MASCGIPELTRAEDIEYLINMMMQDCSPMAAVAHLNEEIEKSLHTQYRRLDNLIHTWIHEQ